jgi:hypothetical protein
MADKKEDLISIGATVRRSTKGLSTATVASIFSFVPFVHFSWLILFVFRSGPRWFNSHPPQSI